MPIKGRTNIFSAEAALRELEAMEHGPKQSKHGTGELRMSEIIDKIGESEALAQLAEESAELAQAEQVEEIQGGDRGNDGYGSTGR